MTDLNELRVFVQVAQTQSFTLAADRLGAPKSNVSRSIASLESRLGVRLIERTTRRVRLTEAGELYFDRCQRILEEVEQADVEMGALLAKPRGRLRIGASAIFIRSILVPVLGEFLASYPDLRLSLQLIGGGAASREKNLDVIIRPGPLEDSGLLVKPLLQIRLGAYASPVYLANRELPDCPADLRLHHCITTSCGTFGEPADSATWRLQRGGESKEVRIESRVAAPDPMITHQLALSGIGIAMLSQAGVRDDLDHGRLVRLLPDWEPEPVQLHALYPSRLNSSPKVRAFLQFLGDRFRGKSFHDSAAIKTARPLLNRAHQRVCAGLPSRFRLKKIDSLMGRCRWYDGATAQINGAGVSLRAKQKVKVLNDTKDHSVCHRSAIGAARGACATDLANRSRTHEC